MSISWAAASNDDAAPGGAAQGATREGWDCAARPKGRAAQPIDRRQGAVELRPFAALKDAGQKVHLSGDASALDPRTSDVSVALTRSPAT